MDRRRLFNWLYIGNQINIPSQGLPFWLEFLAPDMGETLRSMFIKWVLSCPAKIG
jgi:hypothetical protein